MPSLVVMAPRGRRAAVAALGVARGRGTPELAPVPAAARAQGARVRARAGLEQPPRPGLRWRCTS